MPKNNYGALYMPKKGPFNMKPGNDGSIGSANNTPGSFRADSNAEAFAANMPKYELPKDTGDEDPGNTVSKRSGVRSVNLGYGRDNEKLGNKAYAKPGDTVNVSPDRINFLVNEKGFVPPRDTHDSILLSNSAFNLKRPGKGYDNRMFENMRDMHNQGQFHKDFSSTVDMYNQLTTNLVSEKPDYHGNLSNVPYSKRSGNKPNMTKPLYGVVKPMFFKKNKKK
jgi:hypothetical protein